MAKPALARFSSDDSIAAITRKGPRLGQLAAPASIESERALLQQYFDVGYTAISHALIDHWMAELSGSEFKLAVLFLRKTVGDRAKRGRADLRLGVTLADLQQRTGADRESLVRAVRGLESKGLLLAQRSHRKTTVYSLDLAVLLAPWVGKADSGSGRIGKTDSNPGFESEKPTQPPVLESGIPIQNSHFESGKPTPRKEIKIAAAAAAILSEADWMEIRRIADHAGVQIDGKNALALKAAAEQAGLTLAHLRWFVGSETFTAARSPKAVLLTIAKEFPLRAEGIAWPADLSVRRPAPKLGLTREELLQL